ncbi:MAG: 16S rRNA (uracil(1498)-N(3))-methyltransferase [Cyanobium sp.]
MSRELRRLLIDPQRLADAADGLLELRSEERHYLLRVLRCRDGAQLAVVDGVGHLWSARLQGEGRLQLGQPLAEPLASAPPPHPELELALALPKKEVELVWRMATELGADRLVPLVAQRSVRQGTPPLERWAAVLREASEQCERLWLPQLKPPRPAGVWLAEPPRGLGLLATTRRQGLPLPEQLLASTTAPARISLAIGPEGGWSEEEERQAEEAGWRPVSLAPTILRTATAAVAGLAQLAAWRLSSSSFPGPCP